MAVVTLNDKLARNTNNLAGKIYRTSINTSVWNKLVVKGAWQNGISDTQRVSTSERNLADNLDTWTDLAPNANSNTCAIPADVVPRGSTERSFGLTQKAIESEMICVNDGRNAYETNSQIANVLKNLRENVAYIWKRRSMLEYFRLSEFKVVAAPSLPYSDSHMPTVAPTSTLTQKILNIYYMYLIQNSAELDGGSLGMADGRPQFMLVTDAITSDDLMREDGTQNAFLWNEKRVPDLLKALGVERAFRGFYHLIDNLPPRFTFDGGVWTEVPPYEAAAATIGTKRVLSPAYLAAPYMDSFIYLPSVMELQHPSSIASFGSGTSFNPQTYVGDFKWMNVIDVDPTSPRYNPDGQYGFYRALLSSATKPVSPQFGIVIRHLRCPGDIGAQACPANTEGNSSELSSDESFFV